MSNLREILGDRYDAVIERALAAVDTPDHGYQVMRGYVDERDVSTALAAVLPDLLTKAWDEGYSRGFCDRERLSPDMPGRDASEGSTLNPYHTEETDHA